jgi:hypothetical protein
MRKKLHGIVPLLIASLLVGGLALPAVAQMGEQDDNGVEGESRWGWGEDEQTYGQQRGFGYDYDTEDDEFEDWYGESDEWLR